MPIPKSLAISCRDHPTQAIEFQGNFELSSVGNSPATIRPTLLSRQPAEQSKPEGVQSIFVGGGEMGSLMRSMDWSQTLLGAPENWSAALRMMANFLLANRFPQLLWWGPQFCSIYNDAYIPILGVKHPWALGRPVSEVWKEIWDVLKPLIETPFHGGPATWMEDIPLEINRRGFFEETHFTIAYSPVPDETAPGGIGGVLATVHEITDKVIGERRVHALRELGARSAEPKSAEEACSDVGKTLSSFPRDVPFLLLYVLDEKQKTARLACSLGVDPGDRACPESIDLTSHSEEAWPLLFTHSTEEIQLVENLKSRFDVLPRGPWADAPDMAAVVPIPSNVKHQLAGFMIAGLSSRIPFDQKYRDFLELMSTQIAAMIANACAYELERKRAESLAELDRAKTLFFSNISHELRTPLTLLLGPTESALSSKDGALKGADLEMVHRNELRLLKLVNTLLDFSRIEAGRVQAVFEPTELCSLTKDIAGAFRSAMENARLGFSVSCASIDEPIYVDRQMWEKIILNLLSNAFKFTFEGRVDLTLKRAGEFVELNVRDTGVGIPADQIQRVFERFHRIENVRARTVEGTGIGLALVHELVRLHGGQVQVESRLGSGTTFRVLIPFGTAHLPAERVRNGSSASARATGAAPFVHEALRWLPGGSIEEETLPNDLAPADDEPDGGQAQEAPAHVLLADDNRDMREYLQRLLSRHYEVTAVENGERALASALADPPDLVLTDIMMPGLDGYGLLRQLRAHAATSAVPVIMLSARAGKEAESDGLEAGADDYLVKPFTARELLARVGTHVSMYRMRLELMHAEHELRVKAEGAERQYHSILESISEGFLFVDQNWRIRYANERWASLGNLNLSEVIGKDLWQIFPGLEDSTFGRSYREAMDRHQTVSVEEYYAPLDRWFHVNTYPSSNGISIFALDVTERRIHQERLLLTEKLAATGRLAATIAHEINNPLEAVLNLIYLARTAGNQSPNAQEFLAVAEKEVTRVSHIARHTLGFYRETTVPSQVELPALLEEVLTVYDSRLRAASIQVRKEIGAVPPVKALRGEMHQVFSNLISNAVDAMRDGGILTIVIRDAERNGRAGIHALIRDNGVGIPAENLPRLFEPFFTTKKNAGTGLGLWVVKQFVESWGGTIEAASSVEAHSHGTSFNIFVPLTATSDTPGKSGATQRAA